MINLRSEGRHFTAGRCLVSASHYFKFTGSGSPKTRWRFIDVREAWFCFAGIIGAGEGGAEAFALLATAAGPDVTPYHTRQPVILKREDWAGWLWMARVPLSRCCGLLRLEACSWQSHRAGRSRRYSEG